MYITPFVILITAFLAWLVQRNVLARRAAFDYITNHELDGEWLSLADTAVRSLASKTTKDDWADLATSWSQNKLSDEQLEEIQPILKFLNRREFVSICILNGSIHPSTYVEFWDITLVREWKYAKPFIKALRSTEKGDGSLFQKYEQLIKSHHLRNQYRKVFSNN
ncbi:MAG: DUF4760 domain-containing protein [Gammaproteobacteria bacterium]|nr:DUF4760 domain-containing protein [Gammaproteobacteria bacterium]